MSETMASIELTLWRRHAERADAEQAGLVREGIHYVAIQPHDFLRLLNTADSAVLCMIDLATAIEAERERCIDAMDRAWRCGYGGARTDFALNILFNAVVKAVRDSTRSAPGGTPIPHTDAQKDGPE